MRMLGNGRPFVLEVADARSEMPSQQRLRALQEQLKSSGIGVEVLHLQAAPKSILKTLKVDACKSTLVYITAQALHTPQSTLLE